MSELSWRATKRLVFDRADGCCEYCQSCEENTGQPMNIEHINPQGGNSSDNLCLSCFSCNLSKGIATSALDPETNTVATLFNPRTQAWRDHFEWIQGGLELTGLTPTGRATIIRLKMNQQRLVNARRNWIAAGTHPPN